jgi:hypothetical protein
MKRLKRFIILSVLTASLYFVFAVPVSAQSGPSNCPSVFTCVFDALKTKFPFDIFGTLPVSATLTCPLITFFNRDFDFCFLYDGVQVVKYPIIASLLIKIYVYSS